MHSKIDRDELCNISLLFIKSRVHHCVTTCGCRFPYPPWRDDNFVMVIQNQLPLLLMLSFVFSMLQIVKDVVHEKERKIKVSAVYSLLQIVKDVVYGIKRKLS